MGSKLASNEQSNYELFREFLSQPFLQRTAAESQKIERKRKAKRSKVMKKDSPSANHSAENNDKDAEELTEFIDVCVAMYYESQHLTSAHDIVHRFCHFLRTSRRGSDAFLQRHQT
jgi:SLT domain-containing protein